MTTSPATRSFIAAVLLLGACGTDDVTPETVVADAGGAPELLGAGSGAVFWTVVTSTKQIGGGSLDQLPAERRMLGDAPGATAHGGDHVLLADGGTIYRASLSGPTTRVLAAAADTLAESGDASPITVWSTGGKVMWGDANAVNTTTLPKITKSDQLLVTTDNIYVGADGVSERRALRIDRKTREVTPLAASSTFADMFPGGGKPGATYYGRLVGADDLGGAWLVEERAPGVTKASRAILVSLPVDGQPTVLLDRIGAVTGFFTTPDGFYWQEGDAVLSAPKSGGTASIAATITGQAGAVADGYVYYVNGNAIERIAVD